MILDTYRRGLRRLEVCQLRWDQLELKRGMLNVNQIKKGMESVAPVSGEERHALRNRQRGQPESRCVFVSERLAPLSEEGVLQVVKRAGAAAKWPFSADPPILRHACGYTAAICRRRHSVRDSRMIPVLGGTHTIGALSGRDCRGCATHPLAILRPSGTH